MFREYRKLLRITGNGWKFLGLLALRAPFDIVFTMIYAQFLQSAFNTVEQSDVAALTAACLRFGVASLCLYLYNGMAWSAYAAFVVRLEGKLRVKLYQKIDSFSYARVEATAQGEWLTRLNKDVEMPFSRGFHLPHAACAVVNIGISAVILWFMNPAIWG